MPTFARGTVFTYASLDGFTARMNNKFDFFLGSAPRRIDECDHPIDIETDALWPADDPPSAATLPDPRFDFDAMMRGQDAVVLGRATFDRITCDAKFFLYNKPTYVVTSHPLPEEPAENEPDVVKHQCELIKGHDVRFVRMPTKFDNEVDNTRELARWIAEDNHHRKLYVDGGQLIQSFIRAGLIKYITVTIAPVLIGDGYRLFGKVDHDVRMHLIGTRRNPVSGMLQYRYQVIDNGIDGDCKALREAYTDAPFTTAARATRQVAIGTYLSQSG
jgi:dihydrofolate reductase